MPHAPLAGPKRGRPLFAMKTMLRIHLMRQWFTLSNLAMEEALYGTPLYQEFSRQDISADRLPGESTILRFRHLLEDHGLATEIFGTVRALLATEGLIFRAGTVVDATLIAPPYSREMMPGKRKKLNKDRKADALIDALVRAKTSIRSNVERPYRVLKRRFGDTKVKYKGLAQAWSICRPCLRWWIRGSFQPKTGQQFEDESVRRTAMELNTDT